MYRQYFMRDIDANKHRQKSVTHPGGMLTKAQTENNTPTSHMHTNKYRQT